MSLEKEVQEAVGDLLNRLRGSIESELTGVVKATHAEQAVLSRVLAGVRRLDADTTLTAVLDSLGDIIAALSGRAVLLVVEENGKIRPWRFVGFSPDRGDVSALPLTDADVSFMNKIIFQRQTCLLSSTDEGGTNSGKLSFAELTEGRHALVVPVVIGDDVMVLVYADNVSFVPPLSVLSWSEAVELLARYAGRRLEGLTIERALSSTGKSTVRN